jgi:hypothetical protein
MTTTELRLWNAVQQRAALLTPELIVALLVAFQILRDNLSDADLERAVRLGYAEQIAAQLITDQVWAAAIQPVRDRLRRGIIQSVTYFQRQYIPSPPAALRNLSISFDYLNPRVIDAIRSLESRVLTSLETSVRETVRTIIENGLRDGLAPRSYAPLLRESIGLGPTQLQEVENFRAMLSGDASRSLADYALRDKRLDRMLAKGPLTQAQIDRYTDAYRQRRIALNANTTARTAATDAQKLAQRLSWQDAIDKGIVDGDRLMKTWVGVMDDRERPEHVAMEGETVPFGEPFSNGQMIPGDSDYNCRCVPRCFQARAA